MYPMLLLTPQSLRGILPDNEAIFSICPNNNNNIKCSDYDGDEKKCNKIYNDCDCECKYEGNKCKKYNGSCKNNKSNTKKPTKKPSKDDRKKTSKPTNKPTKNLLLEVEEQVSTSGSGSGSGSQDSESLDGYGSEDEVAGSGDSSVSDSGDGGTVYYYNEEDVLNSV
jgi:hypothetical protein